ncbi:unnamed protein product [Spirodela intermedia]|uniref:Uncharacterized protein n=1 Tax=Spirodela intermedia TaxID=51605 RepID=A0A7I8LDB0_SPIIN|nr:unnamed protein product [Spirodela intermedia]
MKASLKFRDEEKPLLRAKIPISVLGLPLLSGASAGEAKDLRLDIATAFVSGPSFRVSYRPNDSWCPFALVVKTGIGALGSPFSSPMTMSAEFNIVGRGGPSFTIQLKPRFGDFCLKKTTRSAAAAAASLPFVPGSTSGVVLDADGEGSGDCADPPGVKFLPENGLFTSTKPYGMSTLNPGPAAGGIHGLVSGAELTAGSVLPLWNRTVVKFRWGLRIPSDHRSSFAGDFGSINPISRFCLHKLPTLVMSKISIEHTSAEDKSQEKPSDDAEASSSVQGQLASLRAENGSLRKAVEELRADIFARRPDPVTPAAVSGTTTSRPEIRERRAWEANRAAARSAELARNSNDTGRKGEGKAPPEASKEDVSEELRRALIGASGGH